MIFFKVFTLSYCLVSYIFFLKGDFLNFDILNFLKKVSFLPFINSSFYESDSFY